MSALLQFHVSKNVCHSLVDGVHYRHLIHKTRSTTFRSLGSAGSLEMRPTKLRFTALVPFDSYTTPVFWLTFPQEKKKKRLWLLAISLPSICCCPNRWRKLPRRPLQNVAALPLQFQEGPSSRRPRTNPGFGAPRVSLEIFSASRRLNFPSHIPC